MRIAHISDLHFGSVSLNPFQFFSKRWLGNFNYLFKRKKDFSYSRLIELIDLFKKEKVTHVIITGDLSVTTRSIELTMGKRFIDLLKEEGFEVFTVPGNHDHYTKQSDKKKRFYRFFDPFYDPKCSFNLKEHKVTYTRLKKGLWLVGLDTAVATSLTSSQGYFSPEAEENLEKVIKEIPPEDSIILMNHFPFFYNEEGKKELVRANLLKKLISKTPNILLYLHGHTHRQTIADLRPNQLPIISDTGSTSHVKGGACHLFTFDEKQVKLQVYRYQDTWKNEEIHSFAL